jgi:antitoxin ParD1/3/4
MHVSLTPNLDNYVRSKVESGMYNNSSEVVREALRLMHNTENLQNSKLEALRQAVDIGIMQAERGEFSSKSILDIANEE